MEHSRVVLITQKFAEQQRAMWSSLWPMGHCAVTSLLLCPVLRAGTGDGWSFVVGRVTLLRVPRVYGEVPHRHAWCQREDGLIADATFGQFVPDIDRELMSDIVLVTEDPGGSYAPYRVFTMDEEEEARRTITPTEHDGWQAGSIIKRVFHEMELEDVTA